LEHVFPYLKGDQIIGDSSLLSRQRSQSLEQLFKSKSYEKLVALESPGRNSVRENVTWEGVRVSYSGSQESHAENCEDIDEV